MSRIAILDDQEVNVRLLEQMLRKAGYRDFLSQTRSSEAIAEWRKSRPDIILLDLHMPPPDGLELLRELNAGALGDDFVPVLVLTADVTPWAKEQALGLGAKDFVAKPFDRTEVVLRVRNLLDTRKLYVLQRSFTKELELRVENRTRALEDAQLEMLDRLATAADLRDGQTGDHARRVGLGTSLLGAALGLPESEVHAYRWAAPLHDVGKVAIPDAILLKPGPLSEREYEEVKEHTWKGGCLLEGSRLPILNLAEDMARWHHERWDGLGYERMRGVDIPLSARVVSVVDVFDALTHDRPYKSAWETELAVEEMSRQSGTMFEPRLVDAFLELVRSGEIGRAA